MKKGENNNMAKWIKVKSSFSAERIEKIREKHDTGIIL